MVTQPRNVETLKALPNGMDTLLQMVLECTGAQYKLLIQTLLAVMARSRDDGTIKNLASSFVKILGLDMTEFPKGLDLRSGIYDVEQLETTIKAAIAKSNAHARTLQRYVSPQEIRGSLSDLLSAHTHRTCRAMAWSVDHKVILDAGMKRSPGTLCVEEDRLLAVMCGGARVSMMELPGGNISDAYVGETKTQPAPTRGGRLARKELVDVIIETQGSVWVDGCERSAQVVGAHFFLRSEAEHALGLIRGLIRRTKAALTSIPSFFANNGSSVANPVLQFPSSRASPRGLKRRVDVRFGKESLQCPLPKRMRWSEREDVEMMDAGPEIEPYPSSITGIRRYLKPRLKKARVARIVALTSPVCAAEENEFNSYMAGIRDAVLNISTVCQIIPCALQRPGSLTCTMSFSPTFASLWRRTSTTTGCLSGGGQ